MRKRLSISDKNELMNKCRMGFAISLMIFVLTTMVGITAYESIYDADPNGLNTKMTITIAVGALVLALILNLVVNYKYYVDLRIMEKVVVVKTLVSKSKSKDYVGGRAGGLSKAYTNRFEFIVDEVKLRVDQELYDSCKEGDKLFFSYAPKSQYLLSIEKSSSHYLK